MTADGAPLLGRALLLAIADIGRALLPAHAERLAAGLATTSRPDAGGHLRTLVPAPAFGHSVERLLGAWATQPDVPGVVLGAAIAAAAHAHNLARHASHVELVVSGPTSSVIHARRTEQLVAQLIGEAQRDILLITFGLQVQPDLRDALVSATARGVAVTVLAEDPADNPAFTGDPARALTGLDVRRLRWPAEHRPEGGAALHAKVIVVDGAIAFITSANLTRRAAGDNLEVGVLIRGGDVPGRLVAHVDRLLEQDVLRRA